MLDSNNARSNDATAQDSDTQNENLRRDEMGTDKSDGRIIGEFQVQRIVKPGGAGIQLKYVARWYR